MAKLHTLGVERIILKTEVFKNIQDHVPSTELAEHLKELGLAPDWVTRAWFSSWDCAFSSEGGTVVEGVTLQVERD